MDTVNMQSAKWKLNSADIKKWLHNTFVFLAPVAIIYLGSVATQLKDGFAWSDFIIDPVVQGVMVLYVVNVVIDFFRKLIASPSN